jgi:hypothetical protein
VPLKNIIDSYPSTNSALLDHTIAVLTLLMDPPVQVEKKELEDPCWVLLDDEGDEEVHAGLAENDLVALLNQVNTSLFVPLFSNKFMSLCIFTLCDKNRNVR